MQRFRSAFASGFTLLEILVVMSIIALLAGLLLPGLMTTKCRALEAVAKTEVMAMSMALDRYVEDEAEYPVRANSAPDENQFPALHEALWGEREPIGRGGRSAPYARLETSRVQVLDRTTGALRPATRAELQDPRLEKHVLDPFGSPYVYRPNRGCKPTSFAMNRDSADIYSIGRNESDDTVSARETSDDIGNW